MTERDPDQDIIDEYERRIAEGTDLEGLTPVKAMPVRHPRAVVSVRVAPAAFDTVARAAEIRGVSVSEFIRDAATAEAKRILAERDSDYSLADVQADLSRIKQKLDQAVNRQPRAS